MRVRGIGVALAVVLLAVLGAARFLAPADSDGKSSSVSPDTKTRLVQDNRAESISADDERSLRQAQVQRDRAVLKFMWIATVKQQQEAAFIAAVAEREAQRQREAQASALVNRSSPPVPSVGGSGRCGGDLPPCSVMMRESGGDPNAFNPDGCGGQGCYGKWQFSGEWACKLGLPCDLSTATEAQQDAAAAQLWNGGAGCSNWSGPGWTGCG